jgi:nicotinamide phosphoribosyltransferase
MLKQFANPGSVVAVVSDSYDIFNACRSLWGKELRQHIIDSGATLVIRPDSGDPATVVLQCLQILQEQFGFYINNKGYKVLNHVRVLQGDGINWTSIRDILEAITKAGFSADNVAFGMGGALLQKVDRDTNKWAMKCSAAYINGEWVGVFKDPITDQGKSSKKGLVTLFKDENGEYYSGLLDDTKKDELFDIYEDGKLITEWLFDEIREQSNNHN